MKKLLVIIGSIIIAFVLMLSISAILIYHYGPEIALRKACEWSKAELQIELNFETIDLNKFESLTIKNFSFKNQNTEAKIDLISVDFILDYNKRFIDLKKIVIQQPHFKQILTLKSTGVKTEKETLTENKLWTLPEFVKIGPIYINQLSGTIQNQNPKDPFHLNIDKLNMEITVFSSSNSLKINSKFELENMLSIIQRLPLGEQTIQLNPTKLNIIFDIFKHESEVWNLNLKSAQLKSSFRYYLKNPKGLVQSNNVKLESEISTFLTSKKITDFKLYEIQKAKWNFDFSGEDIVNTIKNKYSIYANNNLNFLFKTSGELQKSTSLNFNLPYNWDASFDLKSGPFSINRKKSYFKLISKWNNSQGSIKIQSFPEKVFHIDAQAKLSKKQNELIGFFDIFLPQSLAKNLFSIDLNGKLSAPFQILALPVTNKMMNIQFNSTVNLKNVNYISPKLNVSGITGQIPITEKIIIDQSKLSPSSGVYFQDLYTQNPFERVDYSRIDPLIGVSKTLSIEKIIWNKKMLGPFQSNIILDQNFFSVHNFIIGINKGTASGEFFFDLNPNNTRLGFLGRGTNLDINDILPDIYLKNISTSLPMNSRIGLLLDIKKKILNGRLDITKINNHQLLAFLNLIDPNYLDQKMNQIRSWLEYGYPTDIHLNFHEGKMDLDMNLSVLNVKKQQIIKGISIQSFIDKALEPSKGNKGDNNVK